MDMGVLTSPSLIRLSRWLESFLYARADVLLVNSPAYRDYLLAKGIQESKVFLVANGVDTAQFDPKARGEYLRRQWGVEDKCVVTYAGALGPANAIEAILHAAGILRHHSELVFILVGSGKNEARLKELAQEMGLNNVRFVGPLPKSEMSAALAASQICLATLQNIPMFNTTYPNKVFDYMAAGRPVVLGIGGVIAHVVEEAHGGIVVPPEDYRAMARAIIRLADDLDLREQMGRAGRSYVQANFERDEQAKAFAQVLGQGHEQIVVPYKSTKRIMDLACAWCLWFLCAPLLLFLALLIKWKMPGPVLFRQEAARPTRQAFHTLQAAYNDLKARYRGPSTFRWATAHPTRIIFALQFPGRTA